MSAAKTLALMDPGLMFWNTDCRNTSFKPILVILNISHPISPNCLLSCQNCTYSFKSIFFLILGFGHSVYPSKIFVIIILKYKYGDKNKS